MQSYTQQNNTGRQQGNSGASNSNGTGSDASATATTPFHPVNQQNQDVDMKPSNHDAQGGDKKTENGST